MKSHYDTIEKTNEIFSPLNDYWPDIITFPINDLILQTAPIPHVLTDQEIKRFDLFIANWYGSYEYWDFVIWYNNISYISRLLSGDIIYLPEKKDFDRFRQEHNVQR
jgi:hypothetical protein